MRATQEGTGGLSAHAFLFSTAPEMPKPTKGRIDAEPAYRIPKRPLEEVLREIAERQAARDAEDAAAWAQWSSLTMGNLPGKRKPVRRVRFRD